MSPDFEEVLLRLWFYLQEHLSAAIENVLWSFLLVVVVVVVINDGGLAWFFVCSEAVILTCPAGPALIDLGTQLTDASPEDNLGEKQECINGNNLVLDP